MRPSLTTALQLLALVVLLFAAAGCKSNQTTGAPGPAGDDGWTVDVGFLDFPTSASAEAQEHFLRGVAILHSFGWKQAIAEFKEAQEIDPEFALAYWGEALCYNHPLLPERDLESPREVLARLGATAEERAAKAPTEREKVLLGAVEVLFGDGETAARRIGYMEAMRAAHETFPEDDEIAAFYALSLLGAAGPMGDDNFRMAMEAGAIVQGVFARNPDHPGAAHYIIHAFDDPVHAPLALPAAYKFAEIAAAVSHARHMPSHIFIQRGMWDRVSLSNDSAYQAAVDLWEPGDMVADMVHAIDWGHYGDLQRGDLEKASKRRAILDEVIEMSDDADRAVSTEGLMWAREVIETENWATREITDETSASVALATGLSAVALGDLQLAESAAARLETLGSREVKDRSTFQRGTGPARVSYSEVKARILVAEGKLDAALDELEQGVAVAESMGPPRGSATPVKPIHELYGEILLEAERPEEAISWFEDALGLYRNRPKSLLGLARAHEAAGHPAEALAAYAAVAEAWGDFAGMPGYAAMRAALDRLDT